MATVTVYRDNADGTTSIRTIENENVRQFVRDCMAAGYTVEDHSDSPTGRYVTITTEDARAILEA